MGLRGFGRCMYAFHLRRGGTRKAKKYPALFKTESSGVKAGAFIDNDSSPLNKEKWAIFNKAFGLQLPAKIAHVKNNPSDEIIANQNLNNSFRVNSLPTVGGAIYGGISGMGVDYNQDGKNNLTDIAIGAGIGAGATKLAISTKMIGSVKDATSDFISKKILDTDTADRIFGHKIFSKKAYMKYRDDMISSKNANDSDYEILHNGLKELDEQTRVDMHRYMSGDKSVSLTHNTKTLADNYINKINDDTQELVNLGVLDDVTAQKFHLGRGGTRNRLKTEGIGFIWFHLECLQVQLPSRIN